MKRLFAILVLGFLALGIAGFSSGGAVAGPAVCAPSPTTILDDVSNPAGPAAYVERGALRNRNLADGQQLACNSSCARACAARFGRCPTRQCRQAFNACVRSCGC